MPLSSLPTEGPTIPAGATKVSLKEIDTSSTTKNVEVTDLEDSERKYASPPLKDGGANTATATCSVSGNLKSGTSLAVSASNVTEGWICDDYEKVYEAGKYATFSANFSYYPPASP